MAFGLPIASVASFFGTIAPKLGRRAACPTIEKVGFVLLRAALILTFLHDAA